MKPENLTIAVVGDVMLDRHISCEVCRLSPEDDLAPILRVTSETSRPGGAANVAVNLKSLGCGKVVLFGAVGMHDLHGSMLERQLNELDIEVVFVNLDRPTTIKTRYLTPHGRHVARVDKEVTKDFTDEELLSITQFIRPHYYDLIIVSDYAKGMVVPALMEKLSPARVVVDPKHVDLSRYGPVFAITPNEPEAFAASSAGIDDIKHKAEYLVVTAGKNGCYLIPNSPGKKRLTFRVRERQVGDPTGCGDSFVAGFGLALACGENVESSCSYGVAAGACAMDHRGAYAVTSEDLRKEVYNHKYLYNSSTGNVHGRK